MPMVLSFLLLVLTIGTLVDIAMREKAQVKHLPKVAWVLVVILLPLIGVFLWFAYGRAYASVDSARFESASFEDESPYRAPAEPLPAVLTVPADLFVTDTRTTEEQLADLDREIEEWRLRGEFEQRKGDPEGAS